ncbi:MAG: S49 family peptidase [Gammaproteobacteria bacterium]|nr:S49 family peptidase [Gammaproteobacteria bacterium]
MDEQKSTLESGLIQALLSEQKSARRWKNARFFVWLIIFLCLLYALIGPSSNGFETNDKDKSYVSLVRLNGEIMASSNFSASKVIPELTAAFRDKESKGVILLINSPGGSPVQASMIHDKIMQLKEKYHKEVIVVGEDTLASGAYLVATAADKIYVNADTVTGSIGVIMEGFGFSDVMKKIGISRRVFTAGAHKDRLDPFESINPKDQEKIQHILDSVHQDFIADVTEGRKGKLNGDPKE